MVHDSLIDITAFAALGLVIGSFLNVVIFRLPKMMEASWKRECAELNGIPCENTPTYNLAIPRSSCPHCHHSISWIQNIPVLSYIWLRGACAKCGNRISLRYPLVEVATGALFGWCASLWMSAGIALLWSGFCAVLLCLALIDWDTTLLPDDLTLPLLWAGLLAAQLHWTGTGLSDALWGCIGGYMSLWSVYWAFKLITKKEGMGYGDFKLLAALGAWLGWQALIPVILVSSSLGAVVGIALKASDRLREGNYLPFGPFLAFSGILSAFGINNRLMNWLGL